MQDDEQATVARLDAYRAVFREQIEAHQGRVVDMAGDSVLAVFETATGAVQAALDIQRVLREENDTLPEARRMRFRIDVNLGEVIGKADGTVYGDGVNIAARLESLGDPGGLWMRNQSDSLSCDQPERFWCGLVAGRAHGIRAASRRF